MTDDETRELMARHGITATQHTVYHYGDFKYGNLTDALNQAELLTARTNPPAGHLPKAQSS